MRWRLEDLPERYQEQAKAQIAGNAPETNPKAFQVDAHAQTHGEVVKRHTEHLVRQRRQPNQTEAEYNALFLRNKGRYEVITLVLPGGSRYTPDWITEQDGRVTLHEVKGSYRLHSHGRALTAFREAIAAFPFFAFVWAQKLESGRWRISTSTGGGEGLQGGEGV